MNSTTRYIFVATVIRMCITLIMIEEVTPFRALQMVRAQFASERAMAQVFEVSQPTVWRWLNQYQQLPAEHVLRAEQLTGISRHLLRPDIYPADLGPSPAWRGVDNGRQRVSFKQSNGLQQGHAA